MIVFMDIPRRAALPEISGNTALNILHISTQVPNVWEYVSDGTYRDYMIGKVPLKFRHVMPWRDGLKKRGNAAVCCLLLG